MKASSDSQLAMDSVHGLRLNKMHSDSETAKSWYDYILSRPNEEAIKDDLLDIIRVRGPDFKIPRVIVEEMKSEKKNRDYTMPGHNYIGPGTRTTSNILKKIRATSKVDEIALHHDLDQLITQTDKHAKLSDDDAIKSSQYSTNYSDDPLAKLAMENLLGYGFGPKPDPKPEVFDYLHTLHELDEEHMDDEVHQVHYPTTLAKEYYSDQYEKAFNIPAGPDYIAKSQVMTQPDIKDVKPPLPPDNLQRQQSEDIKFLDINTLDDYGLPEEVLIRYNETPDPQHYEHDYADDMFEDYQYGYDNVEDLYINEDL